MPVEKCGVEGNFENMALGGYQAIYEHVHTADTSTSNHILNSRDKMPYHFGKDLATVK